MPAINRQLTARHYAARKLSIQGIVLHDTFAEGTHRDTLYLANPSDGREVLVDFTVEKDGSIWQLNPDISRYATFHAGRATQFKGETNAMVNHAVVGIEIVQSKNSVDYPDSQIQSVAELCRMICSQYNLTASDITTHRQIITDGSRTDPRNFPFSKFWQYFGTSKFNQTAQNSAATVDYKMAVFGFLILYLILGD